MISALSVLGAEKPCINAVYFSSDIFLKRLMKAFIEDQIGGEHMSAIKPRTFLHLQCTICEVVKSMGIGDISIRKMLVILWDDPIFLSIHVGNFIFCQFL